MSDAVFSRERITTVTAYQGFVTRTQLLYKLFTRNKLTKVGAYNGRFKVFFGQQALQCTETIGNYKISDFTPMPNADR